MAMVSNSIRVAPGRFLTFSFCFCCSLCSAICFRMRERGCKMAFMRCAHAKNIFCRVDVQSAHDRAADAQERDTCHTIEMSGTHCGHRCCGKNNFSRLVRARNEAAATGLRRRCQSRSLGTKHEAGRNNVPPGSGRITMECSSAAVMLLAATLSASAQGAVPPDVMKDLAPTGKASRRDQLRQRRAGAEGAERRAQGHHARSRHGAGQAARRARWSSCPTRRRARCSRAPRPAPGMSASSPSSRCAPPRSSSPRPMSSSTAPTWCGRICR